MSDCELLHIEDDPMAAYLFAAALEEARLAANICHFDEGEKALAFLESIRSTFSLIVLDLNLPRLDGWTVLKELRRRPNLQATPVVVVSTASKAFNEKRALEAGAQAYVEKLGDFEAFVADVKRCCGPYLNSRPSG